MPLTLAAPRSRDPIVRFFHAVERDHPNWWPGNSGFEFQRRLRFGRLIWKVCYKVHAIRLGPRRTVFKASITFWPGGKSRAQAGRLDRELRDEIQSQLQRIGYRGKWYRRSWGRWADHWKDVPNIKALAAEVDRLESLSWKRTTGSRRK
jgi:hypothetical protein